MKKYQKPKRRFEKSGFVSPKTAYYVPLENVTNVDNDDMKTMVDQGRYFSIFAPRQSGKTTFFRMFAKSFETNPHYIFIILNFENCSNYSSQTFYNFVQRILYKKLIKRLTEIKCKDLKAVQAFLNSHELKDSSSFFFLFEELNQIIKKKKIVIFIDEFDGIPLEEIENFLTTLRNLYKEYKEQKNKALYSVGLIGIRNFSKLTIGGVSPFNIADHVELPPFSLKNIHELFDQYTHESNQPFTKEAILEIFEHTQGQPWLVNCLGSIIIHQVKSETTEKVTLDDVEKAIEILLDGDNVHFDNLLQKIQLYKDTFKRIMNETIDFDNNDESISFLSQYGLIKKYKKQAVIANPIYKKRFHKIGSTPSLIKNSVKKKIFICYCHENRQWLDQLLFYLASLKQKNIDFWFDESIQTGENWSASIINAIQTSHMAILIVSQQFLNSNFIQKREIPAIINRQKDGMIIFPILVENCLWNLIDWLKEIQIYPKNNVPLEEFEKNEQKKKFMEIVIEINSLLNE